MIIENIKSGAKSDITQEDWEALVTKGWASKFRIIGTANELPTLPPKEDIKPTQPTYTGLVAEAKAFEENGFLNQALEKFKQAAEIKATTSIRKKIEQLEEKLS